MKQFIICNHRITSPRGKVTEPPNGNPCSILTRYNIIFHHFLSMKRSRFHLSQLVAKVRVAFYLSGKCNGDMPPSVCLSVPLPAAGQTKRRRLPRGQNRNRLRKRNLIGKKKRSWDAEEEFCGKKSDGGKEIILQKRSSNLRRGI